MSDMFTTCPNCRLHLAVTPSDLRVGQGYVRCGRCDRVFNALISLAEDLASEQQSGHVATGTTSVPALEEAPPQAAFEIAASEPDPKPAPPAESEPEPEPETELILEPEPEFDAAEQIGTAEEWSRITPVAPRFAEQVDVVEQLATGTFETIVLEGDGFLQTEEHVDEEDVDAQLQRIADQIDDDELEAEEVVIEYEEEQEPEPEPDFSLTGPATHWAWKAAAALLLVLLAAQVVHHYRQALVTQAWAERPLRAVYGLFGVSLDPRWNLKAYDLRQLGGEAVPGGAARIMLRATVQNRATASQPPPMIRVTLQDRFGNALSTTAVAPQEYLHGDPPSRMRADQRLDAALTLDDPNRQAVGFELDACLPDATGQLHCSNDP